MIAGSISDAFPRSVEGDIYPEGHCYVGEKNDHSQLSGIDPFSG
jgi:hypothetical protein